MIYFIFSPDDPNSLVKIGCTKNADVRKRIAQIQTSCPLRLMLLIVLHGSFAEEQVLHHRFRKSLSHGEWFWPTDEIADFILQSCKAEFVQGTKETLHNEPLLSRSAELAHCSAQQMHGFLSDILTKI